MSDAPDKVLAVTRIYLRGDRLQPSVVSAILGATCTSEREMVKPVGREGGKVRTSCWTMKTADTSAPISDQIDALLKAVGMRQVRLDRIAGVEDAFVDVRFAYDETKPESVDFALTRRQISKLGRLGLYLRVTVM